jgi:hypothetical protein
MHTFKPPTEEGVYHRNFLRNSSQFKQQTEENNTYHGRETKFDSFYTHSKRGFELRTNRSFCENAYHPSPIKPTKKTKISLGKIGDSISKYIVTE